MAQATTTSAEEPLGVDLPLTAIRLYELLCQIPNYTWDVSTVPFHNTYDHFHVYGVLHNAAEFGTYRGATSSSALSTLNSTISRGSGSPRLASRPYARHHWSSISGASTGADSNTESESVSTPIVARISTHVLRLEREYKQMKALSQDCDPECEHTLKCLDMFQVPVTPSDHVPALLACIYELPGPQHLRKVLDLGPAYYGKTVRRFSADQESLVPLSAFLDFAIGACECLELLHHGANKIHGSIRQDTFHWHKDNNKIILVNIGMGPRSFENILSSTGWATMSKEIGVKSKLAFIAPEQTGRLPSEPDSRTDIYSLGILFWSLLTGHPAFNGETPLEIIQKVLSARLPLVSAMRTDIPTVISLIIQKMTWKQMDERYNSVNGLKHDLVTVQKILNQGEISSLSSYTIGKRDVSSFFILPARSVGQHEEQNRIFKVIERVHKSNTKQSRPPASRIQPYATASNSSISEHRPDNMDENDDSDASSSVRGGFSRSSSTAFASEVLPAARRSLLAFNRTTIDAQNLASDGSERESHLSSLLSANSDTLGALSRIGRTTIDGHKRKKALRTEVIVLTGSQGSGKSTLCRSVQAHTRRYGYFASSKFDTARPNPFEPMLKVMSSLFRQIFSEKDVTTAYHDMLRSHVRPIWPMLRAILDLPETLIDLGVPSKRLLTNGEGSLLKSEVSTVDAKPDLDPQANDVRDANDFLRGPAATKSIRLINTYLDVLRLISTGKVICLCLDDVQNADGESRELLDHIIKARVHVVLLLAARLEANDLNHEIYTRYENETTTRINLTNLSEEYVFEYVANTLARDVEGVLPLAAVVFEKSQGNPFVMKELLQTLYDQNCLWYNWRMSGWEFDLDRIFDELSAPDESTQGMLSRKLSDLPHASRCILGWASVIGYNFSFRLIQKILNGRFLDRLRSPNTEIHLSTNFDITCAQASRFSDEAILDGLQRLLNTGVVIPGESDDEFQFSHSRYMNAAANMNECRKTEEMHFILAEAMLSYLSRCRSSLYPLARHIALSEGLVKKRVESRMEYRDALWRGAMNALETGATSTALKYLQTCIALFQDNPWDTSDSDVQYDETLQIYQHTAELYFKNGDLEKSSKLLQEIFKHARCSADRTRPCLLQARILSKKTRYGESFDTLKRCLADLGLELPSMTWNQLDDWYEKLEHRVRNLKSDEVVNTPLSNDRAVIAVGTVISEVLSTVFWHDSLLFMQMVLTYVQTSLDRGQFVQSSIGWNMLGAVAIARFKNVEFGCFCGEIASGLYARHDDPFTKGRGWTLYTMMLSHVKTPIGNMLPVLDNALDFSLTSGDRNIALLNLGCMAATRFWAGQDLNDIEVFCTYAPEEFENWEADLRGGTVLVSVRQTVRALQGKTYHTSMETLLDDDRCVRKDWLARCHKNGWNVQRAIDMFTGMAIPAYYLFGYHEAIIQRARHMRDTTLDALWSNRSGAQVRFYLALSLLAVAKTKTVEAERQALVEEAILLKQQIEAWTTVSNVNYFAWLAIISAEIADVEHGFDSVVCWLERAIDHCQIHGFAFEEALAVELMAEFMVSRGARCAGNVMIKEAIASWNRISATGKANQLAAKHQWLMHTATNSRTADAGVQTDALAALVDQQDAPGMQIRKDYTSKWLDAKSAEKKPSALVEMPGMGLDVLDLTSILEFSKVISSELQISSLLEKMTAVILESVGGQAEFCAVMTDSEEQGWCVAASGDHETGVKYYPSGIPFSEIDSVAAQQITNYVLRTKETVFLPNILEDDRFGNVSEAYLEHSPNGRSIICIPILQSDHLMGVIHLEGRPDAFTQRNMIVLTLLTNQVAISLGNALLYKKVRMVSAANAAIVESQKQALRAAREAELKAKQAEAEARHSVKLAEEAAKAKSIFLANVSHELRTPLNGVIGMSELLKWTDLTKTQIGYADSIRVCADTLLTVINDILDFSKLEAGKMQMLSVPLSLRETITEVVRALSFTNQKHGLETIKDLQLPDCLVQGDPVRLHQVFMNLLSNAYKFTPKGNVTVRALVDNETSDTLKVTCSVKDTGIGITQEQLTRLFQPFSQADSSTARSYGGSGLGLSICKAIIENMLSGKIWIESEPGTGTTVSFQLTFRKASDSVTALRDKKIAAKDPDPMASWSHSGSEQEINQASFCDLSKTPRENLRVCIAEDNAINRKIASSFVTKLGLKCDAYEDGKLAYEALQKNSKDGDPYHLVLMDCQMPVLDGYEATKAIRKDNDQKVREVLIIALTASAIRGDREKCLEAGMNDYLAKPVRQAALKTMLDGYLAPETRTDLITPKSSNSKNAGKMLGKNTVQTLGDVASVAELDNLKAQAGVSTLAENKDRIRRSDDHQAASNPNGYIESFPNVKKKTNLERISTNAADRTGGEVTEALLVLTSNKRQIVREVDKKAKTRQEDVRPVSEEASSRSSGNGS